VAEVTAAPAAVDFRTLHPESAIDGSGDGAFEGRKEAGPARAAFEFAIGDEELLAAACTAERAHAMFGEQRA
jgi:hypothetical protein